MLGWLEEKRDELDEEVSDIFQHICDSIEEHHDIAPDSLGNLLLNMETRQRCIVDAIHSSLDDLLYTTEYYIHGFYSARRMTDLLSGKSSPMQ
jgi:hypothetical protein